MSSIGFGIIIKLNNDLSLEEWEEEMTIAGFKNICNTVVEERYYYDKDISNMTENEIETICLKVSKNCNDFSIQNNDLLKKRAESNCLSTEENELILKDSIFPDEINSYEKCLILLNYEKKIECKEQHYYYQNVEDNVIIELQKVEGVGLLLYYDNPRYFNMSIEEQKRQLIEELIYNYGFDIPDDCNNFDKLRYIYHREL